MFLGAWAFTVVGVVLIGIFSVLIGRGDSTVEYLRLAAIPLFALGIPIMMRWLN